eukprot:2636525-Pyramimonas_sp.AAC.1
MQKELATMVAVPPHPHVLRLLGACTRSDFPAVRPGIHPREPEFTPVSLGFHTFKPEFSHP